MKKHDHGDFIFGRFSLVFLVSKIKHKEVHDNGIDPKKFFNTQYYMTNSQLSQQYPEISFVVNV